MEPLADVGEEVASPGRLATVALREVRRWLSPALSLPQARLRNPNNACYLNSSIQALFWSGVMSAQPHAAYGSSKVGMPLIGNKGSPYLPFCVHVAKYYTSA